MRAARAAAAALSVALAISLAQADLAGATPIARNTRKAAVRRAPDGPPLSAAASEEEGESTAGVPSGGGDPLVENGLSSPSCRSSVGGGLSSAAQSNCQTSGFVGAPAPTGNYGLDVNIDVGPFGLSKGGLLSVIQDVFIAPLWSVLVWGVHALVVMLEWCYTLELLGGSTMTGIASSLRETQASFTEPWLALVLAVASALAVYNGLIRRRVADTLAQALTTIAMMALGLWVIADPLGTVGAVGRWADQASLGTLGAVAQGTPANASRTLADSMRALFRGAIETPWCYLEFGNVRWCSDPALLDPGLRKAALSIAAEQEAKLACRPGLAHPLCASSASVSTSAAGHTGELLREADTNGSLFTAFPANRAERNSVKESKSLLHVLCQAEDDTKCTGPTAAQAEFRSDSGTFPRMIGIILIAVGVLGMAMLFGLIALHLLAAAVVSLFMLLLAPFAVLAPALGDGGRAAFASWLTRLLGAVASKLLFSFLLGALLTMQRMLMSLQPLGWWTEWLLISAFWWTVFLKRHQAQTFIQSRGREPGASSRRPIARRIEGAFQAQHAVRHPLQWAKGNVRPPVPASEQLHRRDPAGPEGKGGGADKQTGPRPEHGPEHGPGPEHSAGSRTQEKSGAHGRSVAKRTQLERVRAAREGALAAGDRRRAAKLAVREQRIETELERKQEPRGNRRSVSPNREETSSRSRRERMLPKRFRAGARETGGPSQLDPFQDARKPDRLVRERKPGSGRVPGRPSPAGSVSGRQAPGPQGAPQRKSAVMDDARAVAEARKRQLGYELKE